MMSEGGRDLLARTCKVLLVNWQAQPTHPLLACVLAEVTVKVAVGRSARDHEATAINPFCSGGRCCHGMVVRDDLQSLTSERTQPQNHRYACAVANNIRPQAYGATAARRGPSAMAYSVCS